MLRKILTKLQAKPQAQLIMRPGIHENICVPHFRFDVECFDKHGRLKWRDGFRNQVMTVGINSLLDEFFAGSAYTADWYFGLVNNAGFSAYAAGDTMASHAGWSELTSYDEAARQAPTWSAAAAGSKATDTPAGFTISASGTVRGAFLVSDNTKGGTAGVLYSAGDFSAARTVEDNDTLNVSGTFSGS